MSYSVSRSDKGLVRVDNQDSVFASDAPLGPLSALYIVADGLGGHRGGQVASSEAIRSFVDECRYSANPDDIGKWLFNLVQKANDHVYRKQLRDEELKGMGTTFVAAAVYKEHIYVINVGDSRCYMLGKDGSFRQVTVDHSLVQEMVADGTITPEEARVHPKRNIITRALGTRHRLEADIFEIPPDVADTLLLCSDGLCGEVEDKVIAANLVGQQMLNVKADNILDAVFKTGARDNVSFVLVDFAEEEA